VDRRHTKASPFVLGLTGPIGCGKTTVGDILLELGARERIDADRIVHDLMAGDSDLNARIVDVFGAGVLDADGSINRPALGRIVFSATEKLRQLESLTHPVVRKEIRRRLQAQREAPGVVVVDAVKLLQSEILPLTDAVWVVLCAPEEERRRLIETRGMSAEDAEARLRAQPSFDHPAVTRVIDNNASLMELRENVRDAWAQLMREIIE
jgi:dephospho-CoA kinase